MRLTALMATALMLSVFGEPTLARAEEGTGTVEGVVFAGPDGLATADVVVSLAHGATAYTSIDGAFTLVLPVGVHTLDISEPGAQTVRVSGIVVAEDQVTEIIVLLRGDGLPPQLQMEMPDEVADWAIDATPDETPVEVVTRRVVGQVVSFEDGAAVAGARVFVRGVDVEAVTDLDGQFELTVTPGDYEIAVIHGAFSTQNTAVVVPEADAAEPTAIRIELSPSAVELEAFTVRAPRIEGGTASMLDARREATAVYDVLGAEQMSKSGDSTAASALRRVTGLTVVGGKYVYVRGLGDRYASTLLNGASLPSPEPERRVVPLDLFPTSLLESVTIQKTYSPDMPGEFGGGVVSLKTQQFPPHFVAGASLSLGFVPGTTFAQGLGYQGGRLDWLGFDDGSRALPEAVRTASEQALLKERDRLGRGGYTADELKDFGAMMPNNWELEQTMAMPPVSVSAYIGDRLTLGTSRAGYRAGLVYSSSYDIDETQNTYYLVGANQSLEVANQYDFKTSGFNATLGGILTGGLELDKRNQLGLTVLVNRVSDDETRVYEGINRDVGTAIRVTRLRWLERMLIYSQLTGTHVLPAFADLGVDWRYAFSQARRDEPDRRETRYDYSDRLGDWLLSDRPEGNSRLFSELVDNTHDLGIGLALPFLIGSVQKATLKFGGAATLKDRAVDTRRFKYFGDSFDAELFKKQPSEIFVAENLGPGRLQFQEITRPTDNYAAHQSVWAGYVMTDLPLGDAVTVSVGGRMEHSAQYVETFELFSPQATPVTAGLTTLDMLPAANLSWAFVESMQLRLATSRTVTRPDFRELSPMTFNDVTGGRQIAGNPELTRGLITHFDLRWEWFVGPGEVLAFGGFFKHFDDPIEMVLVPGAQQQVTFQNAAGARNYGVEFEAQKRLEFVAEILSDVYLATNVALIASEIALDPARTILTSVERPLQGQSPYVVNVQLGYDNVDTGTSLALLYNVQGPRIMEVGALGAPDTYEQAVAMVDFVAGYALTPHLRLAFKSNNLLDPLVRYTQADRETEVYRRGRAASLGLSWKY